MFGTFLVSSCHILQVVGSMEELYKFMNQSNATLDLKVGNELATEEGEPAEVIALPFILQDNLRMLAQ